MALTVAIVVVAFELVAIAWVRWRLKRGREQEFEEWVSGIFAAANKFPGYLGSEVLRPRDPDDNEYKIIFRFDHTSNLHAWENSEERQRWLRKPRLLLHEEEKIHALTASRPASRYPPSQEKRHHLDTRWPL